MRAKSAADTDIRSRAGLEWTILRPGRLTDEPGTGLVTLAEHTGPGEVPRDDVAAVLAALLAEPGTARRTLELIGGHTPIEEAVKADPIKTHIDNLRRPARVTTDQSKVKD